MMAVRLEQLQPVPVRPAWPLYSAGVRCSTQAPLVTVAGFLHRDDEEFDGDCLAAIFQAAARPRSSHPR